MWQRSVTLRLTVLFAVISITVLLALGYVTGMALETHFEDQDVMLLTPKLDFTVNIASQVRSREELEALPQHLHAALQGHGDLAIVLASPDGTKLSGTPEVAYPTPLLGTSNRGEPEMVKWREGARTFRGMAATVPTRVKNAPSVLVALVLDVSSHEAFRDQFRRHLWIAVGVSIFVSAILGWVAARGGLSPVRSMVAHARGITANRLKERLLPESVPTELAELASAFNEMLERLDESFRRLSNFSSDLAHELRTPVASLMTHTQVALSQSRTAEEYREVLYANLEEFDRIARMIADMLYLAKADNGLAVPKRETVIVHSEVAELFDFYGALAEEQNIRLRLQGQGNLSADRLMIQRALSNLLSNAIQHTPAGGEVTVSIQRSDSAVTRVEVRNTGSEIPLAAMPRLFERFYRINTKAHTPTEGVGLGLAITKAIAEAHGGRLMVSSSHGTTRFAMIFTAQS